MTISQALISKILYPIGKGYVDTVIVDRGLVATDLYTKEVGETDNFKGALADCLYSLLQAVNFSEADKSIGNLTDEQRKRILRQANDLYDEIGEPTKEDGKPRVIIGDCI